VTPWAAVFADDGGDVTSMRGSTRAVAGNSIEQARFAGEAQENEAVESRERDSVRLGEMQVIGLKLCARSNAPAWSPAFGFSE
jgi:hypothetical protein